jgi:hypothetical protein
LGILFFQKNNTYFKNKHEHRLGFCNSDPDMIKFYLYWLNNSLGIKKENLVARLTLNVSYQNQVKEIEQYWFPFESICKTVLSAYTIEKAIYKWGLLWSFADTR